MFSQIAATQLVQGLREGHDWRYAAADMIEEMQKIIHDYVMLDERQKALNRKADNAKELGLNYEPVKEWIGLTDIEIAGIAYTECEKSFFELYQQTSKSFMRLVEAKLKEKNT